MATKHYAFNTAYTDNQTEYTGAEIARLHKIVDTQLGGAVEAFGAGVLPDPDTNSLKVTAGDDLSVDIAPGRGFIRHSTYGGAWLVLESVLHLTGLAPDSTLNIFVALDVSSENDTRETGAPVVVIQEGDTYDGGLLLAQFVTNADSVVVNDLRNFVTLGGGDVSSVNGQTGAVVLDADDVGAAPASHTHTLSQITDAGTAAAKNVPASGNAATSEVVLGSDTRLTDVRNPNAHAATHRPGGSDTIPTASAAGLANANAEGMSTSLARADHTHKRDVRVQSSGADVGTRNKLNFSGTGVSVTDDAANDRVNVEITAGEGEGSDEKVAIYSGGTVVGSAARKLNLDGDDFVASEDAADDQIDVALADELDSNARIAVRKNSGAENIGARRRINLIEGIGIEISAVDDSGDEEIDVTITATAGGSKHVIQDEGEALAARANLNFRGTAVSVEDDLANDATKVTIDALVPGNNLSDLDNAAEARSNLGLGNVDNTSDADKPVSDATQSALDAKADDDSVVKLSGDQTVTGVKSFSSSPVVPTATAGDNSTKAASTAYADAAAANAAAALVDSAPGALDTLNELAAALGDDADFAGTVTTALAGKQSASEKGAANGYASLDEEGKVPSDQLPDGIGAVDSVNGHTGAVELTMADFESDDRDDAFVDSFARVVEDSSDIESVPGTLDGQVKLQLKSGASAAPSGAAGGVLSGTYPNPGFAADMATQAELDAHTGSTSNPHSVTAAQVGAYTTSEADALLADKADDDAVVKLSGDQTVAGTKTFSSSPIVPTATAGDNSTKAASTAYADTAAANAAALIGVSTHRSLSVQDIDSDEQTAVEMSVELFDTDGFHDNITNPSRHTVPSGLGGYYRITATLVWGPSASGTGLFTLYIRVNGTVRAAAQADSIQTSLHISKTLPLSAGDTVEAVAYQTSGAAVSLDDPNTFLEMIKVG
jgi:hypothetical protein